MLKGDGAPGPLHCGGIFRVGALLLLVQKLEGALGGGQGGLEGVDHIGGLGEGLRRLVHILEEGLDHAHRHGAVQHGLAGDDGDDHLGQAGEQTNHGVDAVGQKIGPLVGGPVGLGGLGHPLDGLRLVVIGLDHIPAVVILLRHAGQDGDGLLPVGGALQILSRHHVGDRHADGHEHQEQQGQGHAVIEHDDERADDGADGHDELQKTGLEYLCDLVQVVGHPA